MLRTYFERSRLFTDLFPSSVVSSWVNWVVRFEIVFTSFGLFWVVFTPKVSFQISFGCNGTFNFVSIVVGLVVFWRLYEICCMERFWLVMLEWWCCL
ncbi:hypothetical protein MtrunA17_Chr3g0077921 [Medicago truncatula]|uniref:Transmembrane protein n=1 Tax=Medicago truncatula TaxID=3880 RepID=A0A396ILP3_MEDTR|nr:hypothetical protein MtrunA17_Chr3g0077921 [Medicago truncatula]